MEDVLVDIDDFRQILADHLDPIKETITKLEKQQEKIVEIMSNQAVMVTNINHIENDLRDYTVQNIKVHDTIFERMRRIEEKSGDKLWDALKLIIAGLFGGIVAWLAGHR